MIDITPVVNAAVILCAAVVTTFLIPWLKANTSKANLEKMLKYVEVGVEAAEQLAKTNVITKEHKFKYVKEFLEKKGYTIDLDEVETLIESFVHRLPGDLEACTLQISDTTE